MISEHYRSGRLHLSFYDDGDREELAEAFEHSVKGGEPYDLTVNITDGKGNRKIVRTIGKPVRDDTGKVVKVRGNFIDVTKEVEAERRIRENEQYVRSIYESADTVGFVITDLGGKDTKILDFSTGAEKIFGLKKGNVVGEKVSILHPPGAEEEFEEMQKRLRKERKGFSGETILLRKGGKEFPALFTIHPRFDAEGNVIGTIGASIDISHLKKAESELQHVLADIEMANTVNETLLKGARMILAEDSFEKTSRKLFDFCRELTGAKSGYVALLSKDGAENEVLFLEAGGMPCDVNPELPMPIRGLRAESYKTGKAVYDNDFMNSEWVKFMPEGHVVLKNVMFAPLNIEGKTVGIMGLANKDGDFDEDDARIASSFGELASVALQKSRFLDDLKTARDRAQNYLDIAGVIILTLDTDGNITMVNRKGCEILGKTGEQLLGVNWFDLCIPETAREDVRNVFKNLIAGNESGFENYECSVIDSNGMERVVSWYNTVLKNSGGKVVGTLSSGLDITDRIAAEDEKEHMMQQLLQSQKMEAIGSLAGGIAHDFNNILTAINGYCQLILPQLEEQPLIAHDVREIRKSADRAASMTRQLLAFSRRQIMKPQVFNVNEVIRDMEKMLKRLIGENIALSIHAEEELSNIKSDRSQLEQVILNLAVNARDAMPDGGRLSILIENSALDEEYADTVEDGYPGNFVKISMKDTGKGMSPEVISHIFEPFFTTKELGEGTGLGLSTVYGIITQQRGIIDVSSEEGKGTVFNIYFPVAADEKPAVSDKTKEFDKYLGSGERILLVEDEKSARDVAVRILHMYGYKVHEAETAEKALELFKNNDGEFDLLFTDIVLPGMNGLDLATRLREIERDLPVLMCSGYTDKKVQVEKLQEENFRFLQKPYEIVELLKTIREII